MSVSLAVCQPGGPEEAPSLSRSGETAAGALFPGLLIRILGQYRATSCPEKTAPFPDPPQPEAAEKAVGNDAQAQPMSKVPAFLAPSLC